jgi:hypothetical protein
LTKKGKILRFLQSPIERSTQTKPRKPVMLPPALLLVVAVGAALLLAFRPPLPALAARPIVAAAGGKPAPTEAAATARWLAAQNTWGVLRLSPSQFLCLLLARDPLLFGGTDWLMPRFFRR